LQFGILLGFSLPIIAVLQLFVPRASAIGVLVALVVLLGFAVWRSAGNLYGHTRAGAEVIVMALMQHDRAKGSDAELTQTMEHMSVLLPGLGHPGAVRLAAGSPAVGRTLGELDLRGITGATVLAITRTDTHGAQAIVPTGKERLQDGDVLALAGTLEGVAMARRLLAGTEILAMQDARLPMRPA
jgi:CPA2 family monovalent cation:H+ antiporter-2